MGPPNCMKAVKDIGKDFDEIFSRIRGVEGFMSERELELLIMMAAYPTAEGSIREIGSYRGLSTVAIAVASADAEVIPVVAVDPLPESHGRDGQSPYDILRDNLARTLTSARVEFHRRRSEVLATEWNRKIRLLWIDGDYSPEAVKRDHDLYRPYVADGGVIALHNVLNSHDGPVRVFSEVLSSSTTGPAGVVGQIDRAQVFRDPDPAKPFRKRNLELRRWLDGLLPFTRRKRKLNSIERLIFRLARLRVPHGRVATADWERWLREPSNPTDATVLPLKIAHRATGMRDG